MIGRHFMNSLKPHGHEDLTLKCIGASCAIDTLIEISHRVFFPLVPSLADTRDGNQLIDSLYTCLQQRQLHGPSCAIRRPVWQSLLNDERTCAAFVPEGRGDAEFLEGLLIVLKSSSSFSPCGAVVTSCSSCRLQATSPILCDPIVYYDTICDDSPGNLAAAAMRYILNDYQRKVSEIDQMVCLCGNSLELSDMSITLPDVLVFNLACNLPKSRNSQEHSVTVHERMQVNDVHYELVGAVQMGDSGDHFLAIVKDGQRYAVVNDLRNYVRSFNCFAAAVRKNDKIMDKSMKLTSKHGGVPVLIYAKSETSIQDINDVSEFQRNEGKIPDNTVSDSPNIESVVSSHDADVFSCQVNVPMESEPPQSPANTTLPVPSADVFKSPNHFVISSHDADVLSCQVNVQTESEPPQSPANTTLPVPSADVFKSPNPDSSTKKRSVPMTSTPCKRPRSKKQTTDTDMSTTNTHVPMSLDDYSYKHVVRSHSCIKVLGNDVPAYELNGNHYFLWTSIAACVPQMLKETKQHGFKLILPVVKDKLDQMSFINSKRKRWIRRDILQAILTDRSRFGSSLKKKDAVNEDIDNAYKVKKQRKPALDSCDISVIEDQEVEETNSVVSNASTVPDLCPEEVPSSDESSSYQLQPDHMTGPRSHDSSYEKPALDSCDISVIEDQEVQEAKLLPPSNSVVSNASTVPDLCPGEVPSSDESSSYQLQPDHMTGPRSHDSSYENLHDVHIDLHISTNLSDMHDSRYACIDEEKSGLCLEESSDNSNSSFRLHLSTTSLCEESLSLQSVTDSVVDVQPSVDAMENEVSFLDPSVLDVKPSEVVMENDVFSLLEPSVVYVQSSEGAMDNEDVSVLDPIFVDVQPSDAMDNDTERCSAVHIPVSSLDLETRQVSCDDKVSVLADNDTSSSTSYFASYEQEFENLLAGEMGAFPVVYSDNQVSAPKDISASDIMESTQRSEGSVQFWKKDVSFLIQNEDVYLNIKDLFDFDEGFHRHVVGQRNGYRFVDNALRNHITDKPEECFIICGRKRTHIAILPLLTIAPYISFADKSLATELLLLLQKIAVDSFLCKKKKIVADSLPKYLRRTGKLAFLDELSNRLKKKSTRPDQLDVNDIKYCLFKEKTKMRLAIVEDLAMACFKATKQCSPYQTVFLVETYSGQRLLDKWRQLYGGPMPTRNDEIKARKEITKDFLSFLLPRRTSTGYALSLTRQVDFLEQAYYEITKPEDMEASHFERKARRERRTSSQASAEESLPLGSRWVTACCYECSEETKQIVPDPKSKLLLKNTGDGFELGNKHAMFLANVPLNDEILARKKQHQSPDNCHPFALVYQSDSRDNMVQNFTQPENIIAQEMTKEMERGRCDFYGSSDEKFFLTSIDDTNKLASNSRTDYNPYGHTDFEHKKLVAETGMRTDLPPVFNREHLRKIFPIVNEKICFDEMHLTTRTVETLIDLEIDKCLSEQNKRDVGLIDDSGSLTGVDLIKNIENNIRELGARNNFTIDLENHSKRFTLNNSAAFTILEASFLDSEKHILHNVITNRTVKLDRIRQSVREALNLPEELTEYDLVLMIWQALYNMILILRNEPLEAEKGADGSPYSDAVLGNYKKSAEIFYQLFCIRYAPDYLTPYCLKLTDYGLYFMKNLPVSINRYSCQGSERINCDFNHYFHCHTTQNGTLNNLDPLLAILRHRFFKLYCALVLENPCETIYQINAKKNILWMLRRHRWATVVAQQIKMWLVKRRLLNLEVKNGKKKENLLRAVRDPELPPIVKQLRDEIFPENTKFVLVGRIKSITASQLRSLELKAGNACNQTGGKTVSQEQVKALLQSHGGNTANNLPGEVKSRSERPYVVLYDAPAFNKPVLSDVKVAYVRNYSIVPYSYIVRCIEANAYLSPKSYIQPLPQLSHLTKQIKLAEELFGKRTAVYRMKRRRKQRRFIRRKSTPKLLKPKLIRNAAIYYAVRRRNQLMQTQKLNFKQCQLGSFLMEWNTMKRDNLVKVAAFRAYNQYRCDFIRENGPVRRSTVRWYT